jgi:hypothetical protein
MGPTGPTGAPGPLNGSTGPTGPTGPTGAPGSSSGGGGGAIVGIVGLSNGITTGTGATGINFNTKNYSTQNSLPLSGGALTVSADGTYSIALTVALDGSFHTGDTITVTPEVKVNGATQISSTETFTVPATLVMSTANNIPLMAGNTITASVTISGTPSTYVITEATMLTYGRIS